jgi:hypothetical protein
MPSAKVVSTEPSAKATFHPKTPRKLPEMVESVKTLVKFFRPTLICQPCEMFSPAALTK